MYITNITCEAKEETIQSVLMCFFLCCVFFPFTKKKKRKRVRARHAEEAKDEGDTEKPQSFVSIV